MGGLILADTAVWVPHIRSTDATLRRLLDTGRVLMHPFVLGELALGNLPDRETVLRDLDRMPRVMLASDLEVRRLIEDHRLFGSGVGYVDSHLLAACRLTLGAALWTHDKRLQRVADYLGLAPELN